MQKVVGNIKQFVLRLVKPHFIRSWQLWAGVVVVILLIVFGLLSAVAAKAPGELGYGIKRLEERVAIGLAPGANLKQRLRIDFAERRAKEAIYVATQATRNGNPDEAKTVQTINQLINAAEITYANQNTQLDGQLPDTQKITKDAANAWRDEAAEVYADVKLLRVQAPDASQLAILNCISALQRNIAIMNDAMGTTPLSASDVSQLMYLVSVGVISKAEANDIIDSASSNRDLHRELRDLIDTGVLPSDVTFSLDQDLIKQIVPDKAGTFEAVAEFNQMQRISATLQAARPTAAQQQRIEEYFKNYTAGQVIPDDDIRPFLMPIVYGMALTGQLQANVGNLTSISLWGDTQTLLDTWKGTLTTAGNQNLASLYQQLMTQARDLPDLFAKSLARVQYELVGAQKTNIAYLVMPPGWASATLPTLSENMGVQIAQADFISDDVSTSEQLSQITITQENLESLLNNIVQTNITLNENLASQIAASNAANAQADLLSVRLDTLEESQANAVQDLQTQLADITNAYNTLKTALRTIEASQAANLSRLDSLAAGQQDVTAAIDELKQQYADELDALASQVSELSVLQIQVQVAVNDILQHQNDLQASIATLQGDVSALQTLLADHLEEYSLLRVSILAQQSSIVSWQEQTQAVINQLTQQQNEFAVQLDAVSAQTQNLVQTVDDVQALASTTQGQLDTLLASEPWAIPSGVYVTQSQLDALQASLDAQFAQKSAELDARFQAYQAQLDSQVQQLSETTSATAASQVELQQAVEDLAAQLEALQAQIVNPGNSKSDCAPDCVVP